MDACCAATTSCSEHRIAQQIHRIACRTFARYVLVHVLHVPMVEPVALRYIVSSMHAVAWAGMACMLLRHRVVAQPSPEPQAVTISDTKTLPYPNVLHAVSLQTLSSDEQHGTCTLCGLLPAALLPELYTVLNQLHIDSCVLCSVVEHLKGLHGRRRHPIGRTTCSRFYGYSFSTGCRSEPNSHRKCFLICRRSG